MFRVMPSPSAGRNPHRLGAGLVATTLVALGLPLAATSASAAGINTPPVLPHSIISFPARDFVSADGYTPGALTTVNVLRGGFVIGNAEVPADSAGLVEVNHPGGGCWVGTTPDIQAGDVIQVLTAPGTGDQTRTAGVTLTQNATMVNASTVTLKGNAISATGGQIPIAQLEARVVANKQSFVKSGGKRTVRADAFGAGDGIIKYDTPTGTAWTATFTGMTGVNPPAPPGKPANDTLTDAQRAVVSESRILWLGTNPGSLAELTIFEAGGATPAINGPAAPCGAPVAPAPSVPDMTSATDLGVSALDNLTSNSRPTFTGVTGVAGATSATLFVDDQLNATAAVVGNRYTLVPTVALANGTHTIRVSVSSAAAADALSPGALSVTIDTVKPTITRRTPLVNATGAAQAANLSATFGEKVFGVSRTSFTLKKATVAVAGTVSYSQGLTTGVATLNPTANLLAATKYTATVTAGVKDLAGNPVAASTWSFTTGLAPKVSRFTPAANATAVSRVANATATFSENVKGLSGTTFIVRKTSTGVRVAATVSYNRITHVATLNPSATLAPKTLYTAVLSVLITDADGNRIPSTGWRFTTRA